MSEDLRDLYQEVILDHNKKPRNFRVLPEANRKAEGYNPLCGDKVTVFAKVEEGVLKDLAFQGSGCAISTSSASLMTEQLKGKTEAEAKEIFRKFHAMVTSPAGTQASSEGLGKLAVLSGVSEFPVRVKCASLAWHTLNAALENRADPVSTE